tara:strand:+ start:11807 stop:12196 length:390 start_codon:yes stop_codon:yes gene_type:complete
MQSLLFRVNGLPAPQGSKRYVGNGIMIEASKKVAPWRAAVKEAAALLDITPFDGPLFIDVQFFLQRPKTVKRERPTVPPDLDKLIRGLFDALTIANVWIDDALVVEVTSSKSYETDDEPPGCIVFIRPA